MLQPGLHYTPQEVLPHSGAMCLIDRIDGYGDDWIESSVQVPPQSVVHSTRAGVPAWIGLEYMAQTVAAYSGIEMRQRGLQPSVGLLIGTRRYQAQLPHFEPGWWLRVRARMLMRDESNLVVFDCHILRQDQILASAEVKAYRPDNIQDFLENES